MMNLGAFLYKIGYNSFIPKRKQMGFLVIRSWRKITDIGTIKVTSDKRKV